MAKFFLVIGILIMLGSGGCSLVVLFDDFDLFGIVMLIGGVPFAVGFLVFIFAKSSINNNPYQPKEQERFLMAKFFLVLGAQIMLGSGGCSLLLLLDDLDFLPIVALIGGIPFAIGGVIFMIAKETLKNKTDSPE